jgi:predicted transcriptional regulator
MKKKMVYLLDQKDEKAIAILEKFGVAKATARALMYVTQVDECRSVDIEQGADLREPEVCRAMQDLLSRGWVKKRQQKNQQKGRPHYLYKTLYRFHELVESFEREKIQEIKNVQRVLAALKRYVDTNTVLNTQDS